MAIRWQWNEKCGEATFKRETENGWIEQTVNLYVGNAYLIMIYEWEENGEGLYQMFSFWSDKQHMQNCLGLNKKDGYTENIHDTFRDRLCKIRLNKKLCKHAKDIAQALVQAFDEITIEIYSE